MRTLRRILFAVPLLALGCHAHVDQVLVEQESRMWQDKAYELECMLDDARAAREATIRENDSLKKEMAGDRISPDDDAPRSRGGSVAPPAVELPGVETPPPARSRRDDSAPIEPPTVEMPEGVDGPGVEIDPKASGGAMVDGEATQLVINKRLTGGLDRDGQAGDEGVMVVFEPRDAQGQLIKSPGAVSVVLMDPALEGDATRVARWDFAAEEVPGHLRNTIFGRGLQFDLPWPGAPPQNRDLRLFIRYTTLGGQKITAQANIDVRPSLASPAGDRHTRGGARASTARRDNPTPARQQAPPPDSDAPHDQPVADEDESAADDDAPRSSKANRDDGVRQASRADRPVWKPYR